jgi:hypothetical protein
MYMMLSFPAHCLVLLAVVLPHAHSDQVEQFAPFPHAVGFIPKEMPQLKPLLQFSL